MPISFPLKDGDLMCVFLDTHLNPVLSCSDTEAFLSRCLVRSSKPLGGVSAAFPVGSTPIRLCQ